MSLLKSFLVEKAPSNLAIKAAEIIDDVVTHVHGIEEMRAKRGVDFTTTNVYQLRVKPMDKELTADTILSKIEHELKTKHEHKEGVSHVSISERAANSGKFSSVAFKVNGTDVEIVVAKGSNRGETFEKELLMKLDHHVSGINSSEQAENALKALQDADHTIYPENIKEFKARSGKTHRSGDISPEDAGKIVADIIIELKDGTKKYVSVKDSNGKTVAQFGVAKAFNDDLSVDTKSHEWKAWLKPFNLDPKKIEEGLKAARDGSDLPFDDVEKTSTDLEHGSAVHHILKKMFGSKYIYLRSTGKGFTAQKIDDDYLNDILDDLKITEIRYPSSSRKQITVYVQSKRYHLKIEVRNPRGKPGVVKPTQIQLSITKSVK